MLNHVLSHFLGVPKYRRGEVWKFLVQQHSIRAPKKEGDERLSKNYDDLLEEPTSHQHAILIDIGKIYSQVCHAVKAE